MAVPFHRSALQPALRFHCGTPNPHLAELDTLADLAECSRRTAEPTFAKEAGALRYSFVEQEGVSPHRRAKAVFVHERGFEVFSFDGPRGQGRNEFSLFV